MDTQSIVKLLHPLEIRVLLRYKAGEELTSAKLAEDLGYKEGHANQAFSWLGMKGLLKETSRTQKVYYEITDFGRSTEKNGTTDEKVLSLLKDCGPLALPEIAQKLSIDAKSVGASFGQLKGDGVLTLGENKKATFTPNFSQSKAPKSPRMELVRSLLEKCAKIGALDGSSLSEKEVKALAPMSKKRSADDVPFHITEREVITYKLDNTDGALDAIKAELTKAGLTGEETGELTRAMLESGQWREETFRAYNIQVQPSRLVIGRTNPYVDFLESVKDKLVGLGFEEFDGPLVETEFWNGDALFMPQFHSARDIHDVYRIKNPTHAKAIEEPYLTNVKNMHETGSLANSRGWGYKFDTEFTRRLILRSQGTVLSAHQLHKAKVPGKYFGIVRCFRYDKVDATHLSDFYQTEGIVLGENVNLRTLLGFLKMFAVNIAGATEVKYVPGYFPFTEPSIEVHIKHPKLGWFELGGSGIFRPEVTKAMGVDVPVLAWGIGIDRMALMALGLNDLRELFCEDVEKVRLRRAKL